MSALCQKQTSRRFRKRHPSCRELSPDCAFVGAVSASQTSFTPGLKLHAPAYEPGKILSLSFFRDEAAVRAWRTTNEHRVAQVKGRGEIFSNYRLRVAGVIRDYGMLEREQVPSDSREVHPVQVFWQRRAAAKAVTLVFFTWNGTLSANLIRIPTLTLGSSADFEHQLAPQMTPFAYPMRLGRVLEPIPCNRRRSDRARIKKSQHPFEMDTIANDVRA